MHTAEPLTGLSAVSGIAIDVGGTKTAVARIEKGVITELQQTTTLINEPPDQLIDHLVQLVEQLKPGHHEKIAAALTGRVNDQGMWCSVNQTTLGNINNIPVASLLAQRLQRRVPIINDAVAGAIAEQRFGAGQGATRLAYITVSTGVGAGIVINGVPLCSPNGLVGHVGFTSSSRSTRICGSGRQGTVESVASGKAIAELAQEAGFAADAVSVFSAFRRNEVWAKNIIQLSASAIAELTADLVAMLDLENVVLGGSVGLADGYLEEVIKAQMCLPALFRVSTHKAVLTHPVLIGALTHEADY